eukprot:1215890-Pyramimonas_sp.AAC.1
MDDISEAGETEFGGHHRDELDQLRKRSLEQVFTEPERNRMETILVKQAAQKATKRLRTVREEGPASFARVLEQVHERGPVVRDAGGPAGGEAGAAASFASRGPSS